MRRVAVGQSSSSSSPSDLTTTNNIDTPFIESSSVMLASSSSSTSGPVGLAANSSMSFNTPINALCKSAMTTRDDFTHQQQLQHLLTRTPKLFLKKQDKKKTCPVKSSSPSKTTTIDSIRFERKALFSRIDQTPISLEKTNESRLINDDFILRRLSWTQSRPVQISRRPLRCLLDSGQCEPDRTETGEFRAFVVAEKNKSRASDYLAEFERQRTSEEFHMRQKEAYNRFKSSVGSQHRLVKSRRTDMVDLAASTTSLIMINTKT